MSELLVDVFSEYSGMQRPEVEVALANFRGINEFHWSECRGDTWEQRARQFYEVADGYVFDLLAANRSKEHLYSVLESFGHMDWLRRSGLDFLEFGGGLGLVCELLHSMGRNVTYVDVPGSTSAFAQWYFARQRISDGIEVVLTPPDRLVLPSGRQWDFIYSDSVIEHLVDPVGTVDTLAHATRAGGILYLLIDAHNVAEGFPMHREIRIDELLAGSPRLRAMERLVHDGDALNVFRQPS